VHGEEGIFFVDVEQITSDTPPPPLDENGGFGPSRRSALWRHDGLLISRSKCHPLRRPRGCQIRAWTDGRVKDPQAAAFEKE